MVIILVILFIVAFAVCFVCVINVLMEYYTGIDNQYPKIKFTAFKKFYSINPDRWNLDTHSVVCKIVNDENKSYNGLFYRHDTERFYFTLFDYLRYDKFHKQIAKDKLDAKHMESTAKMIGMVKKDIANMEDIAKKYRMQAMDNLDSILDNLGGTR